MPKSDITLLQPYASHSINDLLDLFNDEIVGDDVAEVIDEILAYELGTDYADTNLHDEYAGLTVGFWLNTYGEFDEEYPVYVKRDEPEAGEQLTVTFNVADLHEALQAAGEPHGIEFKELDDAFKARIAEDIVATIMDDECWAQKGIEADVYFDFMKREG